MSASNTPAGMDEIVERATEAAQQASDARLPRNKVVRAILTAAGLPALVAECERLRARADELNRGIGQWSKAYFYVTDILPLDERNLCRDPASPMNLAEQDRYRICVLLGDRAAYKAEIARQNDLLQWVERCANHHARTLSAKEALSLIQYHPSIKAITKSYPDGVLPDGPNPYERAEQAESEVAALREGNRLHDAIVLPATIANERELIERAEQAEAERDRLLNALNAALGVGGDFPLRQDGDPPYWWRDWLQKFAGLAYNGERFVIEKGGGTI